MSDSTSQRAVCQALDRLLLEQGCYTPLELLLAEGRLLYSDYETWRQGNAATSKVACLAIRYRSAPYANRERRMHGSWDSQLNPFAIPRGVASKATR